MVTEGVILAAALLGAVGGMGVACLDLLPEIRRLREDNARLRERWRHCFRHHQRHLHREDAA